MNSGSPPPPPVTLPPPATTSPPQENFAGEVQNGSSSPDLSAHLTHSPPLAFFSSPTTAAHQHLHHRHPIDHAPPSPPPLLYTTKAAPQGCVRCNTATTVRVCLGWYGVGCVSMDIENGYHDSEANIIYLESLHIDDTIPNLPPKVFLDHDPKNLKDKPDNKD
ncbi:hypothetical protein Tco_1161362, partial [Tanacetum coccineum]